MFSELSEAWLLAPQPALLGDPKIVTELEPHLSEVLPGLDGVIRGPSKGSENMGMCDPLPSDIPKLILNQLSKL